MFMYILVNTLLEKLTRILSVSVGEKEDHLSAFYFENQKFCFWIDEPISSQS